MIRSHNTLPLDYRKRKYYLAKAKLSRESEEILSRESESEIISRESEIYISRKRNKINSHQVHRRSPFIFHVCTIKDANYFVNQRSSCLLMSEIHVMIAHDMVDIFSPIVKLTCMQLHFKYEEARTLYLFT